MNILKLMEGIFISTVKVKDMADFHNLQGKLEPVTLTGSFRRSSVNCNAHCETFTHDQGSFKMLNDKDFFWSRNKDSTALQSAFKSDTQSIQRDSYMVRCG